MLNSGFVSFGLRNLHPAKAIRVADYFAEEWDERARPLLTLKPDTLFYRHKREKVAQQYIGFFPTMISWQTPAYLRFGGWNACPPSAIHCALHRYWQSIYHAEIVMMSSDIICCRVGKPVESRENALELAKEQYAYCGDLVSQGTGTIGNLASGLIHSAYWLFWWD